MLSTEKIIEIADQHSTPLYILDKEALENRINEIKAILGEGVTLCYAMKANPFFVDAFKHLSMRCVHRENLQYASERRSI